MDENFERLEAILKRNPDQNYLLMVHYAGDLTYYEPLKFTIGENGKKDEIEAETRITKLV